VVVAELPLAGSQVRRQVVPASPTWALAPLPQLDLQAGLVLLLVERPHLLALRWLVLPPLAPALPEPLPPALSHSPFLVSWNRMRPRAPPALPQQVQSLSTSESFLPSVP
jgi:hypothetical protein